MFNEKPGQFSLELSRSDPNTLGFTFYALLFQCVLKDNETIKELKGSLKKANNELKERSLLLDMYKSASKETRDKVVLMAAEKKVRGELDDAR